jgi:hypothetical protein
MNKELLEHGLNLNRRRFLSRLSIGLGSVALGSLLIPGLFNGSDEDETDFLPAFRILLRMQNVSSIFFKMARHHNWSRSIINRCLQK